VDPAEVLAGVVRDRRVVAGLEHQQAAGRVLDQVGGLVHDALAAAGGRDRPRRHHHPPGLEHVHAQPRHGLGPGDLRRRGRERHRFAREQPVPGQHGGRAQGAGRQQPLPHTLPRRSVHRYLPQRVHLCVVSTSR
jgi:hypothetical protein